MAFDISTRLMALDPSSVNVNNVTLYFFFPRILIEPQTSREQPVHQSGAKQKIREEIRDKKTEQQHHISVFNHQNHFFFKFFYSWLTGEHPDV